MKIETSVAELRRQLSLYHPHHTALAPTMGNLHEGHIALVKKANTLADRVVASIFINPLQFGPNEDYHSYPRTFEADCDKLEETGVDVLFAPTVEELYPAGLHNTTTINVPMALADTLCGASRPGHFNGVVTVVNILFNIVQPDFALFGEKDYQQLLVIKRMVKDLHLPVQVEGVPTIREEDGLALSSRNNYLTPSERAIAPQLYQALLRASQAISAGERNFSQLEQQGLAALAEVGFRPDYLAIRCSENLALPQAGDTSLRILAAAWLGQARLIDNLSVTLTI